MRPRLLGLVAFLAVACDPTPPPAPCFRHPVGGIAPPPCPDGEHCARTDDPLDQTGVCVPGPECTRDSDCEFAGQSCLLGHCYNAPPATIGQCAGVVTCADPPPVCYPHMVPVVDDHCYTGACRAIADCEAPPPCERIQHEYDCTSRIDCAASFRGEDCTAPDGGACTSGADCTCASYVFAACAAKPQ